MKGYTWSSLTPEIAERAGRAAKDWRFLMSDGGRKPIVTEELTDEAWVACVAVPALLEALGAEQCENADGKGRDADGDRHPGDIKRGLNTPALKLVLAKYAEGGPFALSGGFLSDFGDGVVAEVSGLGFMNRLRVVWGILRHGKVSLPGVCWPCKSGGAR